MGILPFSISTETEAYTLILNAGVPLTSQRPILFGTTIKLVKMFDFVVFDTPVQVWQVLEEIKPSASSRPTQVPKHAFYPVESQYITLGSNYFSSLEDAIDYLHDNRTNVPGVLHLLEDLGVSSSLDMYGIEIRSEETNPRTIQFIEGGNIDGVAKFTNIVFGANELTSPPVTSYNTLYLENCIIPNSDLPLMEVTRVVASGLTEAGINAFAIPSWYEGSMTVTTYDNAVINPNAISTAFGLTFNVYDNSKASSIQSAGSISTNLFNPKANKRVAGYESNLTFFLNEEHDNQYTDINTQYNSCSIFVGALPPGFSWTGRKTHADNAVTFDAGEGNIIFYGQNTCTAIDTLIEISVGYNGEPMIRLTPPV